MEPFALMLSGEALVSESVPVRRRVANSLGVVDLGRKGDFGRLERVIGREGDVEEEDAARVWRITLQFAGANSSVGAWPLG